MKKFGANYVNIPQIILIAPPHCTPKRKIIFLVQRQLRWTENSLKTFVVVSPTKTRRQWERFVWGSLDKFAADSANYFSRPVTRVQHRLVKLAARVTIALQQLRTHRGSLYPVGNCPGKGAVKKPKLGLQDCSTARMHNTCLSRKRGMHAPFRIDLYNLASPALNQVSAELDSPAAERTCRSMAADTADRWRCLLSAVVAIIAYMSEIC